MRPFIAVMMLFTPGLAMAQAVSVSHGDSFEAVNDYQLGGAAKRSATVQSPALSTPQDELPRLSLPLGNDLLETSRLERSLGAATVFVSEGLDAGRDALELGTFLKRGQARAGLSVTYLEAEFEVARSELFLDYSVSQKWSVGLSGILDVENGDSEPVRQLGVNAEYSPLGGAFVQGGVSGAADYEPVFGLSVGLRF